MVFFGKQYKEEDYGSTHEIIKIMDWFNKASQLLCFGMNESETASFSDNGDGSIQHVITRDGKMIHNQKMPLDVELEYTTPDGNHTKNKFTLDGETLISTTTNDEGKTIKVVREFDGDSMTMTITAVGLEGVEGRVKYQAV